jgi:hypothetical protein
MSANRPPQLVACPRCNEPMTYGGTKNFHEGTRAWDALGGGFELLKHREAFDLYVCARCGRVEFFVDGIGEELRGEPVPEQNILLESPDPPPRGEPWKCPACASRVPGTFDICWQCGAERPPG